jgi:hypothetical protein
MVEGKARPVVQFTLTTGVERLARWEKTRFEKRDFKPRQYKETGYQ